MIFAYEVYTNDRDYEGDYYETSMEGWLSFLEYLHLPHGLEYQGKLCVF